MISHLFGTLAEKAPTHLVVEIGGVGLNVRIPLSSFDPDLRVGTTVKLLTHLHVREDALTLYGFFTVAERRLFELLITVTGIGPPMALNILSGVPVRRFEQLIASEDTSGLTSIKGIGQKLARRLVIELKDCISLPSMDEADPTEEATAALMGLGTSPSQARRAVQEVVQAGEGGSGVEEVIRRALKRI